MKNFAIVSLIFLTIILIVKWLEKHDEKVQMAADRYEVCVRSEYGVSPAKWYAENGVYPECK